MSGFTGWYGRPVVGSGGLDWPVTIAVPSQSAIAQAPTPMSDTSTIEPSPVRSREYSAAATPPAIIAPPIESPNAPEGWPIRRPLSEGVTPQAGPMRDQKVDPS